MQVWSPWRVLCVRWRQRANTGGDWACLLETETQASQLAVMVMAHV